MIDLSDRTIGIRRGGRRQQWAVGIATVLATGVGVWPVPLAAQERVRQARERPGERERTEVEEVVVVTRRPRLGVSLATRPDPVADARGARIRAVLRESPAAEAGLRAGDIVIILNSVDLARPLADEDPTEMDWNASLPAQRLRTLSGRLEAGDTVDITYLRDGRSRRARVIAGGDDVAEWSVESGDVAVVAPDVRFGPRARTDEAGPGAVWEGARYRGLELAPLNDGLAAYFGTREGVLVVDVGHAESLGLRPGDVIQAIGGRVVEDPSDVVRILGSYDRRERVRTQVVRHREPITVEGSHR